jgi:ATP-dependent helicase HepA
VHFDLPAAPNRIEQRLGRLDRFGAGDAIRSMAPVCTDDLAEQAWLSCLADGLKVFDSSMASLQYLVEESLHSTVTDWCNEGVDGLFRWKEKLAGPTGWVARERRRIDQQDAIDAMGDPQSDAFDELEAVDDNWRTWRDAFEGFALTTLLFQRRSEEWTGVLPLTEQVFRLKYSRSDNSPTLLSLPDFLSQFLGTIDTEANESTARAPLTYPYAFRRHTVMSKEGRSRGLRSLRYGDPLVESLRAFCEGDDRGRVFAMWRHRVGFQARDASRIDLWFRFDFLVEADLPVPTDDASRALRRRAEQHFAPRFYTVWVDMTGAVTMEPRDELAEPYLPADGGSGRDFTLNPRRWQILNMQDYIPWTVGWRQHCEQAAQTAHAFIVAHEALLEHIAQSLNAVVDQHKTLVARLESRIVRLEGAARAAERRDLEVECSMQALLASAIRHPSVRTDTVGAIFISALTPFVR